MVDYEPQGLNKTTFMMLAYVMVLYTLFKVKMSILWFEGRLSASDISLMVQFTFGTIGMILSLCYINLLSQDVTNNLHELAECISEAQITDEKWQVITIQKINSFQGFDGHGFFTLGRSHLTSVVSNFITYIIILIQLNQSGGNQTEDIVATTTTNGISLEWSYAFFFIILFFWINRYPTFTSYIRRAPTILKT